MEAGEVGTRQSGPTTANNQKPKQQQYFEPRRPEFGDRSFSREAPQMATATLINPTPSGPYHSHNSSYSPPYPHHSSAPSIASMVSPVESRRTSDDQTDTGSIRQSLPSISDVLSSTPKLAFPPAPPSSMPGSTTLPSPFSTSTRTFPDGPSSEKDASPRTLHPQPGTFPPRPDSLPAPSDPSRASYSRPAPPPLNTFVASQPSPPIRPEHSSQESEQRHSEHSAPPHPNGSSFPGPPPPHPIPYPPAPGPLPPSQLPLPPAPPFPLSPRHPGPPQHSYDTSRPYMYPTDEYTERQRYEMAMRQQLTHFMDLFEKMGGASRTIYGFCDHWSPVVRENHTIPPMASRLPSLREISDMIANADMIKGSLEALRESVQQSLAESERRAAGAAAMEAGVPSGMPGGGLGKGKGPDEPEAKSYYIPEVKKRRGRAAPPGRCHSCARVDTPEWRRGPDGARTLCNACGLHFAKLERKRLQESRSIRPKPEHGN